MVLLGVVLVGISRKESSLKSFLSVSEHCSVTFILPVHAAAAAAVADDDDDYMPSN